MKTLLASVLLVVSFSFDSLAQTKSEDFNSFIFEFSTDSVFQISRIHFPLEKITITNDLIDDTSSTIQKSDWKHSYLFINSSSRTQIYDNFEKKLSDTDERILSFLGIENGLQVYYFFKRLSGKWFLVKIEDLST